MGHTSIHEKESDGNRDIGITTHSINVETTKLWMKKFKINQNF